MTHSRGNAAPHIDVIFFDFSGVLAEEGFIEGLRAIGRTQGLDPEAAMRTATDLCYATGYVNGKTDEATWWNAVRAATGMTGTDAALRAEIMNRFIVRPEMLHAADAVRAAGLRTAILSDHTNWLEEIDAAHGVYRHFDRVFNSFREGLNKRDPGFFTHATSIMGVDPARAAFFDDNAGHIGRATALGIHARLFTGRAAFRADLAALAPQVALPEGWPG